MHTVSEHWFFQTYFKFIFRCILVPPRFGRFALLGKSRPVAQLRAQLRSTSRALWATQDSRVFHTEVSVCVTSGRTLCCYPTLLSRGRTASSGSCFQGYLGAALFRVVDPRGKVLSTVSCRSHRSQPIPHPRFHCIQGQY